ncbi:MAG: DUF4982 domain-containing protein, partial [Planctomycetales bacterium]|nr:DUF4982 domain-containing protein [Planctomycetales bacterium]
NPFFMTWPWHNAWCGDLDLCGFKKPQSHFRDVVWRRSAIELAVHRPLPAGAGETLSWWGWPDEEPSWNWQGCEGDELEVVAYTRADEVRLELNGKVVGTKPVSEASSLAARFAVPYAEGKLRAVALSGGRTVGEATLETTGPPCRVRLTPDRVLLSRHSRDLAFVTVEVVDAAGRRIPDASIPLRFAVDGPGILIGQCSGAPDRPASFQRPECTTFRGRCMAIVQTTGEAGQLVLRCDGEGVESGEARLRVEDE